MIELDVDEEPHLLNRIAKGVHVTESVIAMSLASGLLRIIFPHESDIP